MQFFCFVAVVAGVDVVVIAASADVVVVAAVAAVVFVVFVVVAAAVHDDDIVVVAKVFILDKLYILYSKDLLGSLSLYVLSTLNGNTTLSTVTPSITTLSVPEKVALFVT